MRRTVSAGGISKRSIALEQPIGNRAVLYDQPSLIREKTSTAMPPTRQERTRTPVTLRILAKIASFLDTS